MRAARTKRGSAIVETGPMLYIFFILIFFPLMDLLAMGCQFGCAWYCNFITCRELAVTKAGTWSNPPPSGATTPTGFSGPYVVDYQASNFQNSSLAAFVKVKKITQTAATNPTTIPPPANTQQTVICYTTVTGQPFIWIPLPFAAPGLNADIPWSISSERPREELR
jgi:hypothetical protein